MRARTHARVGFGTGGVTVTSPDHGVPCRSCTTVKWCLRSHRCDRSRIAAARERRVVVDRGPDRIDAVIAAARLEARVWRYLTVGSGLVGIALGLAAIVWLLTDAAR